MYELQNRYNVPYAPPERVTVNTAHMLLIRAIRLQAISDDALTEWEDYWLRDPDWKLVWMLLGEVSHKIVHENLPSSVLY